MTALQYAIQDGNTAVVRELLKGGRTDVNARHPSSTESPLHGALWCRDSDHNVELIQAAGADLAAKDAEGHTPLQAVEKKRANASSPADQACYDAQVQALRAHVR